MTNRKLIEVALPLDEINAACKADKDRKTGTIRNLHKWFAPMPLPAWRALLYAALIDDPLDEEERAYHLELIKRLVSSGADLPPAAVVEEARRNIHKQFPEGLPAVLDPFCGGGSTLLEAQRLGLRTLASDLNPVPVLISRTLTELLPAIQRAERLSLPEATLPGGSGGVEAPTLLSVAKEAQDPLAHFASVVRYFAEVVASQAGAAVGQLFPEREGERPIAWIWARTATCPSPACGIQTVLVTTWWLSSKPGDLAWVKPVVMDGSVELVVESGQTSGEAPSSPKIGDGVFACIACGGVLDSAYLRSEGKAGRLGLVPLAAVVEVDGTRVYRKLSSAELHAIRATPQAAAVADIPIDPGAMGVRVTGYGMNRWSDLFTPRQNATLTAFAEAIARVPEEVLERGGSAEYGACVATMLGLALGKMAQHNSTQCRWLLRASSHSKAVGAFDRADLPMMWDFCETYFRSGSVGDWGLQVETMLRALAYVVRDGGGKASQTDARVARLDSPGLVATDPPYFDAIGYADLSDFFYIWHRIALRKVHPDLYRTVASPKTGELTASPSHHANSKEAARAYFIEGFTEVFRNLQKSLATGLPMLVVYASKEQAGSGEQGRWSSILTAMLAAELEITGTWPIYGTGASRMRGLKSNAVATYVVMAARPRGGGATSCSLQELNRALRTELKPAVERLQASGIIPEDLQQSAMGPGMQVYSRYRAVLDQTGQRVSVDHALGLINQALTEVLDEQEGELDSNSRLASMIWSRYRWADAPFGEADKLARPLGISVDEAVRAQVVAYPSAGRVSVLGRGQLDRNWAPSRDLRPTAWEAVHHLADRLIDGGGVSEAGRLMALLGPLRDQAQALVYRLHSVASRQGWTDDQERYNALIGSWLDVIAESGRVNVAGEALF